VTAARRLTTDLRRVVRDCLPPKLLGAYHSVRNHRKAFSCYSGAYLSWEDARAATDGYDSPAILEKVVQGARAVRDGRAAYERDSVLFERREYSYPLLAALLRAAAAGGNRLSVLDFGGSLGSSYFQCRDFLSVVGELAWNIVEQPQWVAIGRQEFETEQLRFYRSPEECLAAQRINVVLLSSVLPYLEQPYAVLGDLVSRRIPHMVVDRTPVLDDKPDRLTVQHVPAWIYGREASYPAWFFSRRKLVGAIETSYDLVAEFDALDGSADLGDCRGISKGFIFQIKE
jgi:putative methyltransferase (TIGR04325 family)